MGTLATVVSVLLAMGIGPFDLSDGDGKADAAAPTGVDPKKQTPESYVQAINDVCLARTDTITQRLNDLKASLVSHDKVKMKTAMNEASSELKNTMTRIRAVPMPADATAAQPYTRWRDAYGARVEAFSEAAAALTAGNDPAFQTTSEKFQADTEPVKEQQRALNIVCP
ncbi:hypothetical protein [Embleya sp. NBC_00896]|uniref:hypothetical protein n=1 Tax=Embleya sp. NBC_00896 TaxID=2975961 RepID=UPI003866CD90|nr:hypothetical protein OG928_03305 [Embleya sp. NBC_00896]